jgi:hypothetical protein
LDSGSADILLTEAKDAHARTRSRSDTIQSNGGVILSASLATIVTIGFSALLARNLLSGASVLVLLAAMFLSVAASLLSAWAFLARTPVSGPEMDSVEEAATKDPPGEFKAELTEFYIEADRENSQFLARRSFAARLALLILLGSVAAVAAATAASLGTL